MKTRDKSDRRYPNAPQSTGKRLHSLSPAKVKILEYVQWFGVGSSSNIKELLRINGIRSEQYRSDIITDLVSEENTEHGDVYLQRPKEQFPDPRLALHNRHLHLVHDLDAGGIALLKQAGKWVEGLVHGGHWEHQLQEATFLWEVALCADDNRDLTFIPHHRASPLGTPNVYQVPISWEGNSLKTDLKPDAHFAIDYAGKKCHFFYEADRGSEQRDNIIKGKKTIERMIMQYRAFIGAKGDEPLYRKSLGTQAPALVLLHFNNGAKKEAAMEIVARHTKGQGNGFLCFRHDERFTGNNFPPPNFSNQNWVEPWERVGRPPIYINTLKEKAAS